MRIAQIAPLVKSVPPEFYGGTERVVAWLTEELVELGHEVTLFATGESYTRAKLVPVWPRALGFGGPHADPTAATKALLKSITSRATEFDVIHAHVDWLFRWLDHLGVPFVTTLHDRLDVPELSDGVRRFPNSPFISISNSQREPLAAANWLGTIYHGLPPKSLCPSFETGHYLAFLGRLSPDKGPEAAIRIARAADMPLRIAGPLGGERYFKERLEPKIDGDQVRLSGQVNDATKGPFLSGAAALLFPINLPESFGLVMIEAMACGTPVIAFRSGAVPEVVEDGVTGYVVNSEEDAVEAIRCLAKLDRRQIRARFEERFSSRRMAQEYLRHYERLVTSKSQSPSRSHILTRAGDIELDGLRVKLMTSY